MSTLYPRKRPPSTVSTGIGAILAVVLLAAVGVLVGALLFQYLVWNLGVVGMAEAAGGTVADIGLGTAIGAVVLFTWLGSLITGEPVVKVNTN